MVLARQCVRSISQFGVFLVSNKKVAVVGAGIYGSTIALFLSKAGFQVELFDPLGILNAASAINQYRVHGGYHYPRSVQTIREVQEARDLFISEFRDSIVNKFEHLYAIPHEGSMTSPEDFYEVCYQENLALQEVRPNWMNYDFIERCFEVDEVLYDPDILRSIVSTRIQFSSINFRREWFFERMEHDYDHVIYATYATGKTAVNMFDNWRVQVVEKILIRLPTPLDRQSLVVIDGPFTAFDPYAGSGYSLFGSARYTTHWQTSDPTEAIPERYVPLLHRACWQKVDFSHFDLMRQEAKQVAPSAVHASYIGSRFALRLIEHNPQEDRRILHIKQKGNLVFVFSGKVVSAVKAAHIVGSMLS